MGYVHVWGGFVGVGGMCRVCVQGCVQYVCGLCACVCVGYVRACVYVYGWICVWGGICGVCGMYGLCVWGGYVQSICVGVSLWIECCQALGLLIKLSSVINKTELSSFIWRKNGGEEKQTLRTAVDLKRQADMENP